MKEKPLPPKPMPLVSGETVTLSHQSPGLSCIINLRIMYYEGKVSEKTISGHTLSGADAQREKFSVARVDQQPGRVQKERSRLGPFPERMRVPL